MKYLRFTNSGEIELEALTLLGASTKRDDNSKIGMFGSGNKFAIAHLMKHKYPIRIFSGKDEIKIGLRDVSIRNQNFQAITFNEVATGITTEFGKDWETWQALREFYANALDEGGFTLDVVDELKPISDTTQIFVPYERDVEEFYRNSMDYFSDGKEVLFEHNGNKILRKHSTESFIYRKGIRVFSPHYDTLFDYDLVDIDITEDRIARYDWQIKEHIWNELLFKLNDTFLIRTILSKIGSEQFFEHHVTFYFGTQSKPSEQWEQVLKESKICATEMGGWLTEHEAKAFTFVPKNIYNQLSPLLEDENVGSVFKKNIKGELFREIEMSPAQEKTLEEAKYFFYAADFIDPIKYDIIVALADTPSRLGTVTSDKKIVVFDSALDAGVQATVEVILEEYIHIKYNVFDETRAFQDATMREMARILKEKI